MPSAKRPGYTGMYIELPDALYEWLVSHCNREGTRKTAEIRMALKRHLTHPPAETAEAPVAGFPSERKRK